MRASLLHLLESFRADFGCFQQALLLPDLLLLLVNEDGAFLEEGILVFLLRLDQFLQLFVPALRRLGLCGELALEVCGFGL